MAQWGEPATTMWLMVVTWVTVHLVSKPSKIAESKSLNHGNKVTTFRGGASAERGWTGRTGGQRSATVPSHQHVMESLEPSSLSQHLNLPETRWTAAGQTRGVENNWKNTLCILLILQQAAETPRRMTCFFNPATNSSRPQLKAPRQPTLSSVLFVKAWLS